MALHNDLGKAAENLATDFLRENGYEILERNWNYRKFEIDIIAKILDITAIVEVKSRSTLQFGKPESFVNKAKMMHLIHAVNAYSLTQKYPLNFRFDIISVYWKKDGYELSHLTDAFYHF